MLEKTKLLLGIKDNSKDDILNYFIEANTDKILNVIDDAIDIPDNLQFIVVLQISHL